MNSFRPIRLIPYLPVVLMAGALLVVGPYALERQAAQARDTIRKHHLDDIEHALYYARAHHGTYPPYHQPHWCGLLNEAADPTVKAQIEQALRQSNTKYANSDKPFPEDPSTAPTKLDYFYWKRSPAVFELYAILEADTTGERNTYRCPAAPGLTYDYGLSSLWREPSF